MKKLTAAFINTFFSNELDLRVKTFNVLAIGGFLISVFAMVDNITLRLGAGSVLSCALAAALALFLLFYSAKTGKYQLCYMIRYSRYFSWA